MENNYTVYKHTFPNGKIYVGITCQKPQNRWGKDGNGYKNQTLIYRAIQKYGWDNIKHTILCEKLSEEAACKKEQEFISIFNSANPKYGYNNTYGGEHCKHTLISRSKLSKAKLGKPSNRKNCTLSEESKLKISKSRKGKLVGADNPMYGKPSPMKGKHHTEESKRKNSEAHKVPFSDEMNKDILVLGYTDFRKKYGISHGTYYRHKRVL